MAQRPSVQLMEIREKIDRTIISGVKTRAAKAAQNTQQTAQQVVTNPSPSAPGNPPGVRTGQYRAAMKGENRVAGESNRAVTVVIQVKNGRTVRNGHLLSTYLEYGNSKIAARPHFQKIKDQSEPMIKQIVEAPYYG